MKIKKRYSNGNGIDYNSSGTSGKDRRRARRRNRRKAKSEGAVGDIDATGASCGPEGCEATGPSRGGSLATRDAGVSREEKRATRKANREDRRAERRKPKGNLMVVSTGGRKRRRSRGSGVGLFGTRSAVKQGVRDAKKAARKQKRKAKKIRSPKF